MKSRKWSWWEVLLWAYSTLFATYFAVVFFVYIFTPLTITTPPGTATNVVMVILTLPVLLFLVFEGIQHLRDHGTD